MNEFFPPFHWTNLLIIPGLLIGYTVHELGHAFTAYYLGDYSQVERGKLTLNPLRHISWFGSFSFLLFGIGWPNPLEANYYKFRDRHMALTAIALAGPLASLTFTLFALLLTLVMATLIVFGSSASTNEVFTLLFPITADSIPQSFNLQVVAIAFTSQLALASFWLTLTSLLPLPGLDGYLIIGSLINHFKAQKRKKPKAQAVPRLESRPLNIVNQHARRNNISDLHFKIGAEFHETQKYDDAIARYRQAIANDRHFGPAYVNLGLAYLAKGKRKEAIHAFRGTIQYADDQKSQQEAWYQLHQLSGISHVDEDASDDLLELGANPWVDTKPKPNWVSLAIGTSLVLIGGFILYGYLLTNMIDLLGV